MKPSRRPSSRSPWHQRACAVVAAAGLGLAPAHAAEEVDQPAAAVTTLRNEQGTPTERRQALTYLAGEAWQRQPALDEALVLALRRDRDETVRRHAAQLLHDAASLTPATYDALLAAAGQRTAEGQAADPSQAVREIAGRAVQKHPRPTVLARGTQTAAPIPPPPPPPVLATPTAAGIAAPPPSPVTPASLRSNDVASTPPRTTTPNTVTPPPALAMPENAGPLPTIKEHRTLLRNEGLAAPGMHDFAADLGPPPPRPVNASASEPGLLRRWFTFARPQPTAPAPAPADGGVLVLPAAGPPPR